MSKSLSHRIRIVLAWLLVFTMSFDIAAAGIGCRGGNIGRMGMYSRSCDVVDSCYSSAVIMAPCCGTYVPMTCCAPAVRPTTPACGISGCNGCCGEISSRCGGTAEIVSEVSGCCEATAGHSEVAPSADLSLEATATTDMPEPPEDSSVANDDLFTDDAMGDIPAEVTDDGQPFDVVPVTDDVADDLPADDLFGDDSPATPAASAADDLFGDDTPAATPDTPAAPAVDDLFGDDTPAATPETPAAPAVDDLFGDDTPAATPETPAAPAVDDLFGDDTPAATPETPAAPAVDDLFGDDPPAATPETPAAPAVDDLFGDDTPAATPETPAAEATPPDAADLFGDEPAVETPVEEPADDGGIDDLFDDVEETTPATDEDAALEDLFSGNLGADVFEVSFDASDSPVRTWVDNTGLYKTTGRLITIAQDHIKLLKANGKQCTVPLRRLSVDDRQHIVELANKHGLGHIRVAQLAD